MDRRELNQLGNLYRNYIQKIFLDNSKYQNINESIRWCFICCDISISATTNHTTNVININYNWFIDCLIHNKGYEIEYFLIHETRHVFQHIVIKEYREHKDTGVSEDIVKRWIEEGKHYITSIDMDGKVNIDYFKQDVELDAFAFAYALMSYKYKAKYDDLLYVNDLYKNELKITFDVFVNNFKEVFGEC